MKAGVTDWLYVGHPRSTLREPPASADLRQGERPLGPREGNHEGSPLWGGTRPRSAGWIHASAHLRPALCGRNAGWGMNGGWEARSSADGRLRRGL